MYNGIWEWDDAKNELNITKHGFDFWHASYVLDDTNYYLVKDRIDPETGEERWHAIGMVDGAVITLVHTYRQYHQNEKEIIHFISAFESSKRQLGQYFSGTVD